MKEEDLGMAKDFTDEELRRELQTEQVKRYGNHGFAGLVCPHCNLHANVFVSYLWTFEWTCTCGSRSACCTQTDVLHDWKLAWDNPSVGPSREVINQTLRELGLHGLVT